MPRVRILRVGEFPHSAISDLRDFHDFLNFLCRWDVFATIEMFITIASMSWIRGEFTVFGTSGVVGDCSLSQDRHVNKNL